MRYLLTLALLLSLSASLANAQVWLDYADTSPTVEVVLVTSGALETGAAYDDADLSIYYTREGAAPVEITLATQTTNGAWTSGGFVHAHNGSYRLDLPLLAIEPGVGHVLITGKDTSSGTDVIPLRIQLSYMGTIGADGLLETNVKKVNDTSQTAGDLADLIDTLDGVADGIKTKTDYLPSATAGAAGGVFIAGTNAATTITSSTGSALTLNSTGGNGHGLRVTGNGTGEGISAVGGATGNGFDIVGGSTSGNGLYVNTTDGDAFQLNAQGSGSTALVLSGSATGKGIDATGDIGAEFNGTAYGLQLSGPGNAGLNVSGGFDVAGGLSVAGGASIANSAGTALTLTSSGSNGNGMLLTGHGSGSGLYVDGGASSGDGITVTSTGIGLSLTSTGDGIEVASSANALELGGTTNDFVLANATNTNVGNTLDGIKAEIGTDGDGLTSLPWNASWDAEVQSEATDALNAYDPPTKSELDTGLSALDSGSFHSTTVSSITSTTQYVLTDGPPSDADLQYQLAVFVDSNGDKSPRVVTLYDANTSTITVNGAPGFTVNTSDTVKFYPISPYLDAAVSDVESTTQPRINYEPSVKLKLAARNDGAYVCNKPVRVLPGTFDIEKAVGIDCSPFFGRNVQVETVGTCTVSSGSITATPLGPRDEYAMIQLDGTATAGEEVTVDCELTMDNGDKIIARFEIEVGS